MKTDHTCFGLNYKNPNKKKRILPLKYEKQVVWFYTDKLNFWGWVKARMKKRRNRNLFYTDLRFLRMFFFKRGGNVFERKYW